YSYKTLSVLVCLSLAACGGGGGGGGTGGGGVAVTPPPPSGPVIGPSGHEYHGINDTTPRVIQLGGAALRNRTTGRDTVQVNGQLEQPSGALVVSDPDYVLSDPSGRDGTGTATDANGATVQTSDLGGYEYLTVGTMDYVTAAGPTTSVIVIGAITQPTDMPVTGQVTYTGTTVVDEFSPNCQCRHEGTATVNSDFQNGTVQVTLDGFTTTSTNASLPPDQNFDRVILADMSITGSQISGGTAVTELNGTEVTLYGPNPDVSIDGTFYGLDHVGNPDEVGGVFVIDGTGALMGVFVAD
ncbi:MAG: transferrin-binding protein-like solute binding protein, partial [Planktomarina sp.]